MRTTSTTNPALRATNTALSRSGRQRAASRPLDAGTVTRHPHGGPLPDINTIDDYAPDYAGSPQLADAMQAMHDHYRSEGFADSPQLRDKLGNLADARGITREQAMAQHHKLHDMAVGWGLAPPMDPAQMSPEQQARYQDRVVPDIALPDGYWGSATQLGSAHAVGQLHNGLIDVFSALASPSLGITGPGTSGLPLSDETFGYMEGDGLVSRAYNALASVGNWFTDLIGDHSKFHDAVGQSYTNSKKGPGYAYAPPQVLPTSWPAAGQVSGLGYSLGRKVSDLFGQGWGVVKDFFSNFPSHDQASPFQNITEQRDFSKFAAPGQTLSEFRAETAQRSRDVMDAVTTTARDAWDGAKDLASDAVSAARDFGRDVANGIGDAWDSLKDAVGLGDEKEKQTRQERDKTSDNDRPGSNPSNGGSNASHSDRNSSEDGGAML